VRRPAVEAGVAENREKGKRTARMVFTPSADGTFRLIATPG
jgi:hypothetical protein